MVERSQNESVSERLDSLSASHVLKLLSTGERVPNNDRIAIVFAHQDDESIALGAQMNKLESSTVIHVTDGAPENSTYWQASGIKTREQYAHIRDEEVQKALDLVGHKGTRVQLGNKDQEAAFYIERLVSDLKRIFQQSKVRCVFTHAYEGGHPDHDATAVAVHLAVRSINKECGAAERISIIEAPLYRMDGDDSVRQRFVAAEGSGETVTIPLSKEQVWLKSKLYDVHRSQHGDIFNRGLPHKVMSTEFEWFRVAPEYDFETLPNQGNLSKIFTSANLTPARWKEIMNSALKKTL